jgi:UDP-N-acetylmuramoyl-tripeptide--D-alanyl-D-alanine ligase
MSIEELYKLFEINPFVSTDTRDIKKGCLFFALKGDNFNGNNFASQALGQGASFAVIDEAEYNINDQCILVNNVLITLQELASFHRKQLGIPILAITGTNGKTTTKELVTAVLSKKFSVTATKGNLNNHIGVPLTLLSMNKSTQLGIVEMGANHQGEIAALCEIATPNFGLITNVGKAHLEGFGSFEGVKKTKGELYRFIDLHGGNIFLNTTNNHLIEMAQGQKAIGYRTTKEGTGLEAEQISCSPMLIFKVKFPKGWLYIKTNLVGGYNLENALAAVCIGQHFDVDPQNICKALEDYTPANNRSQYTKTQFNQILMDAYNANPTSMSAALDSFESYESPLKAVILGDMFELGDVAHEEHQKIANKLSSMKLSLILLAGKEFSKCQFGNNILVFEESSALKAYLENLKPKGYLILVKGSRGMKLEQVVDCL